MQRMRTQLHFIRVALMEPDTPFSTYLLPDGSSSPQVAVPG
jgi:hypothetical protein